MYFVTKTFFVTSDQWLGKPVKGKSDDWGGKPVGTNDSPSKLNKYTEKTMLELHVVLNNKRKVEQDWLVTKTAIISKSGLNNNNMYREEIQRTEHTLAHGRNTLHMCEMKRD